MSHVPNEHPPWPATPWNAGLLPCRSLLYPVNWCSANAPKSFPISNETFVKPHSTTYRWPYKPITYPSLPLHLSLLSLLLRQTQFKWSPHSKIWLQKSPKSSEKELLGASASITKMSRFDLPGLNLPLNWTPPTHTKGKYVNNKYTSEYVGMFRTALNDLDRNEGWTSWVLCVCWCFLRDEWGINIRKSPSYYIEGVYYVACHEFFDW
jgi:hypothetical protein